jgi:general secretion pathway protein D
LLGNLFRQQSRRKVKTNLLLFLTPYIIRDSSDFGRIFDRKMKERQQFVEQFYGATTGYDVAIDFARKAGPLARVTQVLNREMRKIENGGPGAAGERIITPAGTPKPGDPTSTSGAQPQPGAAAPPPMPTPEATPTPVREPNPELLKVQPEGLR